MGSPYKRLVIDYDFFKDKELKIDQYITNDKLQHIVPRCFTIDVLCFILYFFFYQHVNNEQIQTILHKWFAEFRKISIADQEIRYHGKVDYKPVEAIGFAYMIINSM